METITACENVCRDFSWVRPFLVSMQSVAIIVGVFLAWRQLESWRLEARSLKRSENAAELIASSYDVEDAFRFIRNPMDSVPVADANKPLITFERRFDRVNSQRDLFRRLRDAQIQARVIIGNEKSDSAVGEFFKIRAEVSTAIEILADYKRDGDNDPDTRKHKSELRRKMSGTTEDATGRRIQAALDTVVEQLSPIARLEKK